MTVKQHVRAGFAVSVALMILTFTLLFNYPRPPLRGIGDTRPLTAEEQARADLAARLPPLAPVMIGLQVLFLASPLLWGKLVSARCPRADCRGRAYQKGFGPGVYVCRTCGHEERTGVSGGVGAGGGGFGG